MTKRATSCTVPKVNDSLHCWSHQYCQEAHSCGGINWNKRCWWNLSYARSSCSMSLCLRVLLSIMCLNWNICLVCGWQLTFSTLKCEGPKTSFSCMTGAPTWHCLNTSIVACVAVPCLTLWCFPTVYILLNSQWLIFTFTINAGLAEGLSLVLGSSGLKIMLQELVYGDFQKCFKHAGRSM